MVNTSTDADEPEPPPGNPRIQSIVAMQVYRRHSAQRAAWIARWLISAAFVLVIGIAVFALDVESSLLRVAFWIGLAWTMLAFLIGRPAPVEPQIESLMRELEK